jgi:hypothetical protein
MRAFGQNTVKDTLIKSQAWIPAFAGMTEYGVFALRARIPILVIPANAGIQSLIRVSLIQL